jgi:predicted nucleic acid-binding protein
MRVVSNTSPISNLAIIGRLELLRRKHGLISIPIAVRDELLRLSHAAGSQAVRRALSDGWLIVEDIADRSVLSLLLARVDQGEAEAIELARQTAADMLLIDELAGRQVVREMGLPFIGLLGVLLEERIAGRIVSLKAELDRLRGEAGFFVAADLEQMLLRRVGEAGAP